MAASAFRLPLHLEPSLDPSLEPFPVFWGTAEHLPWSTSFIPQRSCSPPRPASLSLLPSTGAASWASKSARARSRRRPRAFARRVHAHGVRVALNTREAGKPAASGGRQEGPGRRAAAGSSCPAGLGSSAFAPAWATLVGSERAF